MNLMVLSAKRVGPEVLSLPILLLVPLLVTYTLNSLIFLLSIIFAFDLLIRTYRYYVWALIYRLNCLVPCMKAV